MTACVAFCDGWQCSALQLLLFFLVAVWRFSALLFCLTLVSVLSTSDIQ